jgi:hypothetical protein
VRRYYKREQSTDWAGPLTFEVTNFLNVKIAKTEEVLAFMPEPRGGAWAKMLRNQREHQEFYRSA